MRKARRPSRTWLRFRNLVVAQSAVPDEPVEPSVGAFDAAAFGTGFSATAFSKSA